MRKLEIILYTFDELSKEVQSKVLKQKIGINFEFGDWWDCVYDDAQMVGIKIISFDIERGRIRLNDYETDFEKTAKLIIENHGTVCSSYDCAQAFLKTGCKNVGPFLKGLEEYYLKVLDSQYNYLYSDEGIKETIKFLELEFLEDGTELNLPCL